MPPEVLSLRKSLILMLRSRVMLLTKIWNFALPLPCGVLFRRIHRVPFLDFYNYATGHELSQYTFAKLQKKFPQISSLTKAELFQVDSILQREGIAPSLMCQKAKILTMPPVTIHNHCCVLKEFGFTILQPIHIIKYHAIVREQTITEVKRGGLLPDNMQAEEVLLKRFETWPTTHSVTPYLDEDTSSLLQVREKILSKYLNWRLNITEEEWQKINKCYTTLKHRPIPVIEESIQLAENELKFSEANIRRNGFLIAADPNNTRNILQIGHLAGIDIGQVIRFIPAVIKSDYKAILRIIDILEQYGISEDAQRRCFGIFCLNPDTVQKRLESLSTMKEYQVLSKHPRALQMVVHYDKVLHRLTRLHAANKTCYTLGNLLCSKKTFEAQLSGFGNKICSRDLASVISYSLNMDPEPAELEDNAYKPRSIRKTRSGESIVLFAGPTVVPSLQRTQSQLKRHKYWRHVPHRIVHENIDMLRTHFDDATIYRHCQVLLYPVTKISEYLDMISKLCSGEMDPSDCPEELSASINYSCLSPDQVLSLTLYCLERRHHFTGDGIWSGDRVGIGL